MFFLEDVDTRSRKSEKRLHSYDRGKCEIAWSASLGSVDGCFVGPYLIKDRKVVIYGKRDNFVNVESTIEMRTWDDGKLLASARSHREINWVVLGSQLYVTHRGILCALEM